MPQPINILGLDVGAVRTGVALARRDVQIASPHGFITASGNELVEQIATLVKEQQAGCVVVGLPRGMQGQSTKQTQMVLEVVDALRAALDVPVRTQDESLTSHHAEKELQARGKPYEKGDIDAWAAMYILQDYLLDHQEEL